jgi:hypothetical protein
VFTALSTANGNGESGRREGDEKKEMSKSTFAVLSQLIWVTFTNVFPSQSHLKMMNTLWFVSLPHFLSSFCPFFHQLTMFLFSCFADSEIFFDILIDVIVENEGESEREKGEISNFLLKLEQLGNIISK